MIPISYTFRNLVNHKLTSVLTIFGISLVVFVFAAEMMLTSGIKKTLVATGSEDNVIVIRKAAQSEVLSILMRDQANIISESPEIAKASDKTPLLTKEIFVLISLNRRAGNESGNVVVSGSESKVFTAQAECKIDSGEDVAARYL